MYLNRVELIGFLGSDAETKTTANGKTVTNLSLATKTSYLKDGERQERTEWHRIECWGRLAEYAGAFRKGAQIHVEGELRSHEYQREVVVGDQRTAIPQRVWEIRVDSVLKLDRAAKRESTGDGDQEVPR